MFWSELVSGRNSINTMSKIDEVDFVEKIYPIYKAIKSVSLEMNIKKPYYLIEKIGSGENVIDERIAFLMKDVLRGFMKNGVAGRKSAFLKRDDIGLYLKHTTHH